MKNPLISIIVVCYNRAHLLPGTLDSVFQQSYNPVEIIVVDDASTDRTQSIIKQYGDRINYVRHEKNKGVTAARNTGASIANGEFIAYQDDDDIMVKNRITDLFKAFIDYPAAVLALGNWAEIDDKGVSTGKDSIISGTDSKKPILIENGYEAVLWPRIPAAPHTTLFRKIDGDKIGWFDERFQTAGEDKDFYARLAKLGTVIYIPQIVSLYRTGHNSLSGGNNPKLLYSRVILFKKHLQSLSKNKTQLRKRLQIRMQNTLISLKLYSYQNKLQEHGIPVSIIKEGYSLLSAEQKARYIWNVYFKRLLIKNRYR